VIAPTLAFVVNPDRMTGPLQTARTWLVQRNNTIITVVFAVIGAELVGDGVGQLKSFRARGAATNSPHGASGEIRHDEHGPRHEEPTE
jgi:hypothetical protein